MEIRKSVKESFSVIGKEGSSNDGSGFAERLWADANSHFSEVEGLAKRDGRGNLLGVWGLMSDFSRSFSPWEDHFSKGLYLAGVEVRDDAAAPPSWVKWTVPAFEYLYAKAENGYETTFSGVLTYMNENTLKLAGAVQEYNCPEEHGQLYLFFPIRRL